MNYKVWLVSAMMELGDSHTSSVVSNILETDPDFSVSAWVEAHRFFRDEQAIERLYVNLRDAHLPL